MLELYPPNLGNARVESCISSSVTSAGHTSKPRCGLGSGATTLSPHRFRNLFSQKKKAPFNLTAKSHRVSRQPSLHQRRSRLRPSRIESDRHIARTLRKPLHPRVVSMDSFVSTRLDSQEAARARSTCLDFVIRAKVFQFEGLRKYREQ